MDPDDPRWREHLDIVTAWGEASAGNQTPPPTDEQLWAASRIRADLNLPEQIDTELLEQLREAFDNGHKPTRIDLQEVADALHERGHHAYVEHTGGNTATLYAGRQAPSADTSEFIVGPDSDDTWAVTVPERTTMRDLVDLIMAVIDEVETRRARFVQAADA